MGNPGRVYEQEGYDFFRSVKKGGIHFFDYVKRGLGIFFSDEKGRLLFIFPNEKGGQQHFSTIIFWGANTFYRQF